MLSLLSTCQPCSGKASTTVPSGQIPFYQSGCTALAHVMPGGNYGSQTVSCYTTTAAHQASASEPQAAPAVSDASIPLSNADAPMHITQLINRHWPSRCAG